MKLGMLCGVIGICLLPASAHAATLQVTYVNNTPSPSGFADATRVTFRFATSVDNDNYFTFASFYDRTWHAVELLPQGVTNVLALMGPYPASNLVGTTFSGSFTYDHQGEILGNYFSLREHQSNGNFYPASFSYYASAKSLTLQALWDSVPNGSVFRFLQESYIYDATGTAADFVEAPLAETPLPAAAWLFGSIVVGCAGFSRWRRRKLETEAIPA